MGCTQSCELHHGPVSKSGQLYQILKCVHCLARLQRTRCAWMKLSFRKPQNGGLPSPSRLGLISIASRRDVTSSAAVQPGEIAQNLYLSQPQAPGLFENFGCFCPLLVEAHVPFTSDRCLNARATPRSPFLSRARTSNLDCGGDHCGSDHPVISFLSLTGSLLLSHCSPSCPSRDGYLCVWARQIGSGLYPDRIFDRSHRVLSFRQ